MIVIDIGCSPQGGDSIGYLVREFKPKILYGFDPSPAVKQIEGSYPIGNTKVIVERKAAWTENGWLNWVPTGYGVTTPEEPENFKFQRVRCFDLAAFILSLGEDGIHLKMDCEGAEYPILEHMIQRGASDKISLLWIEWHFFEEDSSDRKRKIVDGMPHVDYHSWNL